MLQDRCASSTGAGRRRVCAAGECRRLSGNRRSVWLDISTGAKICSAAMSELLTRGPSDIRIAAAGGLAGVPDPTCTAVPQTAVQTCNVHPIRNPSAFATWKDGKKILADFETIYRVHDGRAFRTLNVPEVCSRESTAFRVRRRLRSTGVIEVPTDQFILSGIPAGVRSCNHPKFIAEAVQQWTAAI